VLKRYAETFYKLGGMLDSMAIILEGKESLYVQASEGQAKHALVKEIIDSWFPILEEHCESLELKFCSHTVARLKAAFEEDENEYNKRKRRELLCDLDQRIRDELQDRGLFYVRSDRIGHYEDYREGWEPAVSKFPIATDVEEAEKCYALERFSGCVYHLMRVAETGVQELAKHVGLTRAPIIESWGEIIKQVRSKAATMPRSTIDEKEKQRKISDVADALWQVNVAWRIPADHPRTPGSSYNQDHAEDAIGRVKILMRTIAEAMV
jgi:hypothetical protein